ncbi:MAG: hypothetical protein HZB20_07050 [Chloroflexi bacterium]|nr:hypothetical protein [Chloroflexota bacterium]
MIRKFIIPIAVIVSILAAACAPSPASAPEPILVTSSAPPVAAPTDAALPTAVAPAVSSENIARTDSQASVEFVITPLNLASPTDTLDFDVSMNTHSVDLSWDLAAQSVLATDAGLEVQGQSWAIGSGHHYEGTLTFPAKTADGKPLLDGAKKLTLTIKDAGVAERIFVWELSK